MVYLGNFLIIGFYGTIISYCLFMVEWTGRPNRDSL